MLVLVSSRAEVPPPRAPRCNASASVTATAGRVSVTRLAWSSAVEHFGSECEIRSCKGLGDVSFTSEAVFTVT